jgi:hypothetical protein
VLRRGACDSWLHCMKWGHGLELLLTWMEPNHEQLQDAVSRMRPRLRAVREVAARRSLFARVHRAEEISARASRRRRCAVTTATAGRRLSPAFEKMSCHGKRPTALRRACLQPGPAVWYRCTTARTRSWNNLSGRVMPPSQTPQRHAQTSKFPGARACQPCQRPKASSRSREASSRRVACSPLIQAHGERARMYADGYVLAKRGAALQRPTRTRGDVCSCTAAARTLLAPTASLGARRASMSCGTHGSMERVAACR